MRRSAKASPDDPLFPTRQGRRSAATASAPPRQARHHRARPLPDPALQTRLPARPAPHHRDALLAAGVDTATIALWLGHESTHHDRHLPARRPAIKQRRDRPHHPAGQPPRPLPAARPPARVPRSPQPPQRPGVNRGRPRRAPRHRRPADRHRTGHRSGLTAPAHRDALLVVRDPANDPMPQLPRPLGDAPQYLAALERRRQHRRLLILRDGPTQRQAIARSPERIVITRILSARAFARISARHCSGSTPSGELTSPRRNSSA